ncbi:hypothetical protein ACS0TY_023721 [Phlomoides rotata]
MWFQGCDEVTLAFFGDGNCNNVQFFECLNMAALWKLPIIFVVENNLWAIGMSHLRSTSDPQIWKKGPTFGLPGVHVDAEKAHYATRDPITALKKYLIENNLANEGDMKVIEKKIDDIVEESVELPIKAQFQLVASYLKTCLLILGGSESGLMGSTDVRILNLVRALLRHFSVPIVLFRVSCSKLLLLVGNGLSFQHV